MKSSFKLKIAALSLAVSGTLLAAFGTLFFMFAFHSGIGHMDQEIRTLAESSLRRPQLLGYWENFEKSLQFIYGESEPQRIAITVIDPNLPAPFQSKNAPIELLELAPAPLPLPPDRPFAQLTRHWMSRLDRDKNQLISKDEFDGRSEQFSLRDANRDGNISESEAIAYRSHSALPASRGEPPHEKIQSSFQTVDTATGTWRIGIFQTQRVSVIMSMNMRVFYADIHSFRTAFIFAVPLALLALGLAGWFMAARALRPVSAIARTAAGITAKGFDQRIPPVASDIELQELVTVANGMLDRLEKSYRHAVRFSADAAHELQTPLTILQGELDNAIHTSENGSTEQQRYSALLAELSNLKSVVQKLLLLSHADEGRLNINHQSIDLSELMQMAAEDLELMAPTLDVSIEAPAGVEIEADPIYLNQILRNLTSNVAKYTTAGGSAHGELRMDDECVFVTFTNTAPAIPAEDQLLIFDRFHRVDSARTTAGAGLGLSLAREIARAHGGDIVLNQAVGNSVSFTLTLPRHAPKTDAV